MFRFFAVQKIFSMQGWHRSIQTCSLMQHIFVLLNIFISLETKSKASKSTHKVNWAVFKTVHIFHSIYIMKVSLFPVQMLHHLLTTDWKDWYIKAALPLNWLNLQCFIESGLKVCIVALRFGIADQLHVRHTMFVNHALEGRGFLWMVTLDSLKV